MGLLKAVLGSISGNLADQWKEFFCCESLSADVLVAKGRKKINGRSSNSSSDNVISKGSKVIVADGQCAIIVNNGHITEIVQGPGGFEYDNVGEPSIFSSSGFTDAVKTTFKDMYERFSFGGVAPKDERIYFVNTKEIIGNKYGTAAPVPFRVVDQRARIDMDISIKCFGEYSFKITNPILFYTNVCSNVADEFTRDQIMSQLKTELLTALQPTFAVISEKGIRYSALPGHTLEISEELNRQLSAKWRDLRGIEVVSFGVSSVTADEEDAKKIKQMQEMATYTDPTMAAARLVGAQANAMETAAGNSNGAMAGFMGMGMANNMGGMNAQNLFAMGQQTQQAQQPVQNSNTANSWKCDCGTSNTSKFCQNCGKPKPESASWKCDCGNVNSGKFCQNCGKPKPADNIGWNCSCGTLNKGKFCQNCGSKKPEAEPLYKCDKCGWEPADPKNPPKFCPECGDIFNENDIVR